MSDRKVITVDQFVKYLIDAGLVDKDQLITRVVIDAKAGDVVKVYVEQIGDERMLIVKPPDVNPTQISGYDSADEQRNDLAVSGYFSDQGADE